MDAVEDGECPYLLRFEEWYYRYRDFGDASHTSETVSYLGLSSGVYEMDDGSTWEVGSFPLAGTEVWKSVPFQSTSDGTPSVFLTMQTRNGGNAATVRVRDVGATEFGAAIFEEEFLTGSGHNQEDIGYVALYHPDVGFSDQVSGQATFHGIDYPYTLHRVRANHQWTTVDGVELKVEEEQSLDS